MPSNDRRLKLAVRRRLRTQVGARGLPCHLCGQPIDYSGPWDLDELIPRALGGDPLDPAGVAPAHARCNRAAGGRLRHQLHPKVRPTPTEAGEW